MKDAYYFSHDSNARNDQKILAVRMKYGIRGYGIYFGIIEMLRESKEYELLNDWSTIAYDLREPQSDIEEIVKNFDLFIITEDRFYSESLKRRMLELDERRAKRSEAGRIGGLASASKRQAIVNDSSSSKVKESKVNKEKNINSAFAPPTQEECLSFFSTNNSTEVNARNFFDHFTSNGWKVGGRAPMKDWQASARKWIRNPINQVQATPKIYGYTNDKKPVTNEKIAKIMGLI